jgi:dimethylhistidine N-methyltransferase
MISLQPVRRIRGADDIERTTLLASLLASPASIAPKYFYDTLGCTLFTAICELDEYYPTRTERAIFADHRHAIAAAIGTGVQFVDLGAGDGRKAEEWFGALAPRSYLAVDIAAPAVASTVARMKASYPSLRSLGVVADFSSNLDLFGYLWPMRTLFFYPGSSIGNFEPIDARRFLRSIHAHCADRPGSALLIGVDTKKDPRILEAAYDDALGVTAAFNRNVLRHVNAMLGSNFQPRAFAHRALYNADPGRIEMYLEASARQQVRLRDQIRLFDAGERILTEYSYKYTPSEFQMLLRQAGFAHVRCWQDPANTFAVFLAR